MFVLVIGGGKVGYYLTKELIGSGHEVVLMEKDKDRANQIADEIGSIVISHDGCEGKYLAEAGANRADIVAAVTGDDEDNLVICQMAKHHFDVPRTIARVNNPKNEELFKHLGVDELISPTRMILGSIEQDIPVHELLHLAALGEGELELIEAHLQAGSPAIGRAPKDLPMPEGCSLFAVIRDGVATPLRPDTILAEGDKVIAIGKGECQDAAPRAADRRRGGDRRRALARRPHASLRPTGPGGRERAAPATIAAWTTPPGPSSRSASSCSAPSSPAGSPDGSACRRSSAISPSGSSSRRSPRATSRTTSSSSCWPTSGSSCSCSRSGSRSTCSGSGRSSAG